MKKILMLLGVIALASCGYDSFEECVLRETQKGGDRNAAIGYCRYEFPVPNDNPYIDDTFNQPPSNLWDRLSGLQKIFVLIISFNLAVLGFNMLLRKKD
tara:strand:+ start:31 stop:327 length:297 start_codon:yes stop_codon:yes gene_type:complete